MKAKRFTISPELLLGLLALGEHAGGYTVVRDGIPADAVLLNVRHAWPGQIEMLVSSETFPETPTDAAHPLRPKIVIPRGIA